MSRGRRHPRLGQYMENVVFSVACRAFGPRFVGALPCEALKSKLLNFWWTGGGHLDRVNDVDRWGSYPEETR